MEADNLSKLELGNMDEELTLDTSSLLEIAANLEVWFFSIRSFLNSAICFGFYDDEAYFCW